MSTLKSPKKSGRLSSSGGNKKDSAIENGPNSMADDKKVVKSMVNDKSKILSSAKSNFLNSTEQKNNPLKRSSTPSPEKAKHIVEHLLSPTSLKKAGLNSPPKKVPKLWKSKWQLATLSGPPVSGGGKRKKASEASRLLDDEGVIHMLNRVPNVYGDVPKVPGTSNSRMARARSAANKAIKASNNQQAATKQKQQQAKVKKERLASIEGRDTPSVNSTRSLDSPKTSPVFVKHDASPSQIQDMSGGVGAMISPRRASRHNSIGGGSYQQQLQHVRNIINDGTESSGPSQKGIIKENNNEDCFSYLSDLPADILDSVTNCDIRYSLPSQGLPVDPSRQEQSNKAIQNKSTKTLNSSTLSSPKPNQNQNTKGTSKSPSSSFVPPVTIKQEPLDTYNNSTSGTNPSFYTNTTSTQQQAARRILAASISEDERRVADVRRCLQLNDRSQALPSSPVKSPGAFTEIYVRLYENFAQVTFSPGKSKLSYSLGPAAIDEIIQLLNFVSSTRMYHAVLFTGIGNIFCQGIDLFYLCHDHQEKRKELASEMANAVERLIMALVRTNKMLIAAVNGEATGLGLAILPFCDFVYASEKATFKSYSSRLGHIAEGGLSIAMSRQRSNRIQELILVGRELTSEELMAEGLINHLYLSGRLMEEIIPRVRMLCNRNQTGIQCNKALMNSSLREEMELKLAGETRLLTEIWSTKEFWKTLVNFVSNNKSLRLQKASS